MTTQNTGAQSVTNRVVVIGMLDTMLIAERGGKRQEGRAKMVEVTRRTGRDRSRGGRREELMIQARSPFGGMFAMKIELEPDVPGAELLQTAVAETLLAFEGTLQLKRGFDPRFARDEQDARGRLDRGLPTRTLQLDVSRIRLPEADEQRASSAVWLEGIVAEPPRVARHPDLPSVELASTILRVTTARPANFPGLSATVEETVEINVAVPTSYDGAEMLYRVGNRVRLVGQIDCRMERQAGPSVAAKLGELDTVWAERHEALADNPAEQRRAARTYRNQRMRFEETARLVVLALMVEGIEAEPMALAETYAARRDWVRTQREERSTRRERREADQQRRSAARPANTAATAQEARNSTHVVEATIAE